MNMSDIQNVPVPIVESVNVDILHYTFAIYTGQAV
jgi:hypothetical protein